MANLRKILIGFLALAVASIAVADTMPKDLADTYKGLGKAMDRLDFKLFSSSFDPEFVLVSPESSSTPLKDFLAMIQPMFSMSKSGKADVKLGRVTMNGDYAEVEFDLHVSMKGKDGVMKVHEIGTDFWHKKNGKWLIYRTVESKLDVSGPGH